MAQRNPAQIKAKSPLGRALGNPTAAMCVAVAVLSAISGVLVQPRSGTNTSRGGSLVREHATPAQDAQREAPPLWFREHDFGSVKVKVPLQHAFQVKNDSDVVWTVANVHSGCACAVAANATRVVRPGEVFELTVNYRPPVDDRLEHRRIEVHFKQVGAPVLVFEIRARVVPDFSISDNNITIDALAKGSLQSKQIQVYNNSEREWDGLDVSTDKPWLRVAVRPEIPNSAYPWRRQQWKVETTVDSEALPYGRHEGHLSIRPTGADFEPSTATVVAVVNPPVAVVPSQFFLGEVGASEQRSFELLLRFSPDVCPDNQVIFSVVHDMGEALKYDISRLSNGSTWIVRWKLDARLLVVRDGYARGNIRVVLKRGRSGAINIPLAARIKS